MNLSRDSTAYKMASLSLLASMCAYFQSLKDVYKTIVITCVTSVWTHLQLFETWSPWYAYTCVYYHPKPRRLCYKALSSQLRLLQICLCKVWHRSLELGTEYLASVFANDRSSTCSWCVKKLMQFLLLDIKLFLSFSWYSGCFLPKLQCGVIPQIDRVQLTQFFHRYTRVGHCMQRLVRDSSRLQIQRSIHEVIIMFDLTCGQDSICITVWAPHPCAHQAFFSRCISSAKSIWGNGCRPN